MSHNYGKTVNDSHVKRQVCISGLERMNRLKGFGLFLKRHRLTLNMGQRFWKTLTPEERALYMPQDRRCLYNGMAVFSKCHESTFATLPGLFKSLDAEEKRICTATAKEINKRSHMRPYLWTIDRAVIVNAYRQARSTDSLAYVDRFCRMMITSDINTETNHALYNSWFKTDSLFKFLISHLDVCQHEGLDWDQLEKSQRDQLIMRAKTLNDNIEQWHSK